MAFNPVPSEVIHKTLESAGFSPTVSGKEVVYERANHNCPSLKVRVFTSAKVGASKVVGCGKDAIRIVLIYTAPDGKTYPVGKKSDAKRVYRTGETADILSRLLDRARCKYGEANEMAKIPPCKCGAPKWLSGNCAAFCWKEGK